MKKICTFIFISFFSLGIFAQNLQVHYDFGEVKNGFEKIKRDYVTSTLEFFKPDEHGNTYVFVDMDYDMKNGGVQTVYWEISRDLRFWKMPLELHGEFTGGNFVNGDTNFGGFIGRSWIFGLNVPWMFGKFAVSGAALYRHFRGANGPDFQFSGTWAGNFLNDKLTLSGFIDVWSTDNELKLDANNEPEGKIIRLMAQPQIWYNINKTFSLGSEFDISRYFITYDGVDVMPTVAVKWNF
jgi:hypothetical protein